MSEGAREGGEGSTFYPKPVVLARNKVHRGAATKEGRRTGGRERGKEREGLERWWEGRKEGGGGREGAACTRTFTPSLPPSLPHLYYLVFVN